jgi:hypothetical protein
MFLYLNWGTQLWNKKKWHLYTLDISVVFWIFSLLHPLSVSRNVWKKTRTQTFLHAPACSRNSAETGGTKRYTYYSAHSFHTALQRFLALWYFEFCFESVWTFQKRLKCVTVVTVLSIVTALRRKSVLVVMGDTKGSVNSFFRAYYLLPFSCFVDIHVSSSS